MSPVSNVVANSYADLVQNTLLKGNYEIFDDLAWQYRAYQASGIWALQYASSSGLDVTPTTILPVDLTTWTELYQGDYSSAPSVVQDATKKILQREQQQIAQRSWNIFHASSARPAHRHLADGPRADDEHAIAHLVIGGADALERDLGQREPDGFVVENFLRDHMAIARFPNRMRPVRTPRRHAIADLQVGHVGPDGLDYADRRVTGIKRILDPPVPVAVGFEKPIEGDILRAGAHERERHANSYFARARFLKRKRFELDLLLAGEDETARRRRRGHPLRIGCRALLSIQIIGRATT